MAGETRPRLDGASLEATEVRFGPGIDVLQERAIVLPATHWASSNTDATRPPMGLRLRLKAGYDISGFATGNQVILTALKEFGMIVADNGSDWFLSGAHDPLWDDDELGELKSVPGSAFEVVDTGPIYTDYADVPTQ